MNPQDQNQPLQPQEPTVPVEPTLTDTPQDTYTDGTQGVNEEALHTIEALESDTTVGNPAPEAPSAAPVEAPTPQPVVQEAPAAPVSPAQPEVPTPTTTEETPVAPTTDTAAPAPQVAPVAPLTSEPKAGNKKTLTYLALAVVVLAIVGAVAYYATTIL